MFLEGGARDKDPSNWVFESVRKNTPHPAEPQPNKEKHAGLLAERSRPTLCTHTSKYHLIHLANRAHT